MKNIIFSITAMSLFLISCEESLSPFDYERQVVVTALLEAGRSIDSIKIMYTGEVDRFYTPTDYAIPNAQVRVIGMDVSFDDTLVYDPTVPGRYYSKYPFKIIVPTKTYRLEVRLTDGKFISASTTVPDTFRMTYATITHNSILKYSTAMPVNFFVWSPSRFQGTYLPTITSLDSGAARITKSFMRDTVNMPPPDKIAFRVGLPKDQNYTELPWVFLNYYGKTRFDIFAIDENYNKFLNQFVTTQGSELKEIRYPLQGGIGFFGSRTRAFGDITVTIIP